MKKLKYEINSFENPWVRATVILGVIILILTIYNYLPSTIEKQKEKAVLNLLEFAQANKFAELCNIEQRVCCNTQTGICKYIEKEEN